MDRAAGRGERLTGGPATRMESDADQIEFWNGPVAALWTAHQAAQDAMLAPLGERAMAAAAFAPGQRVLDVGCGCGGATLEIARRVGPAGRAIGIDVSAPMLARARERAAAEPGSRASFETADAATRAFAPGAFDRIYSRFGVMFFADPTRAFENLRAAMGKGGRLAFVCWRSVKDNPWALAPIAAAGRHLPPMPRLGPEDPGPFSFKDPDRIRRILTGAGFEAPEVTPFDAGVSLGPDLDAAVPHAQELGPASLVIAQAPPDVRSRIAADLREALSEYLTPTGVTLDAATWIVTAGRG